MGVDEEFHLSGPLGQSTQVHYSQILPEGTICLDEAAWERLAEKISSKMQAMHEDFNSRLQDWKKDYIESCEDLRSGQGTIHKPAYNCLLFHVLLLMG